MRKKSLQFYQLYIIIQLYDFLTGAGIDDMDQRVLWLSIDGLILI
jgi:hypothetical protein